MKEKTFIGICTMILVNLCCSKRFPDNWYGISKDELHRLRRRDFEFKSHDIVSIIKELKNGSDPSRNKDENLEKLKVGVYVYDDQYLQVTNLENKDLWSSVPYTAKILNDINEVSNVQVLRMNLSTVKASSIPSGLKILQLESTRITDGTLSSALKRNSLLQSLFLKLSGDFYASDLSFARLLEVVELEEMSVHFAPNADLHQIKHLNLRYGTFMDPRILKAFGQVFRGLESLGLDQTHFDILKKSLLDLNDLNWIRIWKVDLDFLQPETALDEILIDAGRKEKSLGEPVELVKENGVWRLIRFK